MTFSQPCPPATPPAAQLEEALSFCIAGYQAGVTVLQAGQRICLYPFPPACQFVKSSREWQQHAWCWHDSATAAPALRGLQPSPLRATNTPLPPLNCATAPPPPLPHVCAVGQDDPTCKYYTVQGGDSLDTIADGLSLTRKEVVDANPGLNPNAVAVNSFVQLPPW